MPKARNLFIDAYDTIRDTLKSVTVYGCYTAQQVQKKLGISESQYKENLQRLRFVMNRKFIQENKNGKSKIIRLSYDRYDNIGNLLIRSYKTKYYYSKIMIYLMIIQVLSDKCTYSESKCTYSAREICDRIDSIRINDLYKPLDELTELGIVQKEVDSTDTSDAEARLKYKYTLQTNILEDFDTDIECLYELHRLMYLFRNLLPMSSLGYMSQEIIRNWLKFAKEEEIRQDDPFIFKDTFFWQMLDDEVLLHIIVAIEEKKKISFLNEERKQVSGIPVKVLVNRYDQRQYLFYEQNKRLKAYRLDKITNIKIIEEIATPQEYDFQHFQTGFVYERADDALKSEKIVVDFIIPDKSCLYILKRLEEEKGTGTIDVINELHWVYSVQSVQPTALIPWLRSFKQFAVVRKSSDNDFSALMADRWKEILNNYEQEC